jgi:hypothetical protein
MIQFDPAVSVQPLAGVKPGSFVRWGENGEHLGFAVRTTNDPSGQMSLVQYDAPARRFVWQYADPQTVLSYDGDCVVRPDLQSFSPSFAIAVDSSLYWLDGAPYRADCCLRWSLRDVGAAAARTVLAAAAVSSPALSME